MCVCVHVCMFFCVCVCAALCPGTNGTVQDEIVNLHNHFRRNVSPTAANMLKMVSPAFSTRTIKAAQIIFADHFPRVWFPSLVGKKNNKVCEVLCTTPENHRSHKQLIDRCSRVDSVWNFLLQLAGQNHKPYRWYRLREENWNYHYTVSKPKWSFTVFFFFFFLQSTS